MSRVQARFEKSHDEIWRRRASSFGDQAAAYAEHRPDYAEAAVGWALEPVRNRGQVRVLDLGAGTGKLTGVIARLAAAAPTGPAGPGSPAGQLSVVAVEPDPAMLAELRRALPDVRSLPGKAEDIPLPDASVDAVLCGQAAHWFDMDRALPEIARVLTPGGVFAGLWNLDDDRVDWVAGLSRVCPLGSTASDWLAEPHDWPGPAAGGAAFRGADQAEFGHGQLQTADSLVATIATHSRQLVMDPAERRLLLDRVRDYLRSRPETATGEFRMPMLTGVLRSVKN
jgi:SAM-dependent methyltransferase